VITALRERLAREEGRATDIETLVDEVMEIGRHAAGLLVLDPRVGSGARLRRAWAAALMVIDTSTLLAVQRGVYSICDEQIDEPPGEGRPMQTLPRLYRWTRAEYDHLIELGAFQDKRVELIEGKIVETSPKGPRHAWLTNRAHVAVERAFPADRFTIRSEQPLALGQWNEPEPDVAVAAGDMDDYQAAHPTAEQALLVVEVADPSVAFDLGDKADVYAAAGIADYWVVDVAAGRVVVLRAPRPDTASATGQRYAEQREHRPGDKITPLAAEATPIAVADLLP
jgi:Uma2 family endonuclease